MLSDFADVLGGKLAGDAAVALSAGSAAAFVSGTLGYFQASSSRAADRRLALAGLGGTRVAIARLIASIALAALASAAAFAALILRGGVAHPAHVAVAIAGFAPLYLAVGVLIGSIVSSPLEGSLIVVLVVLLDAFAGPGMTGGSPPPWAISQDAADILIAAGLRTESSGADWVQVAAVTLAALAALMTFVVAARRRT